MELITRIGTRYKSLMRGLLNLYKKHGAEFDTIDGDDKDNAATLKSDILKYDETQKKKEQIKERCWFKKICQNNTIQSIQAIKQM
ncbi:hypothetical protein Tco_1002484 [Tanacetum coccineum]|uniref:Uncharacterized protein n=1 Tax=Tanacetum coccineum TaxID=301880 RepID=A0ABQ5F6E5_9ASTR